MISKYIIYKIRTQLFKISNTLQYTFCKSFTKETKHIYKNIKTNSVASETRSW